MSAPAGGSGGRTGGSGEGAASTPTVDVELPATGGPPGSDADAQTGTPAFASETFAPGPDAPEPSAPAPDDERRAAGEPSALPMETVAAPGTGDDSGASPGFTVPSATGGPAAAGETATGAAGAPSWESGSGSHVPLTVLAGSDTTGPGDVDDADGSGPAPADGHGSGSVAGAADAVSGAPGATGTGGPTAQSPPTGDGEAAGWPFPRDFSLEGGGPDTRFIEDLYRELEKKRRIENDRRGP
jgi:hypothetical protein